MKKKSFNGILKTIVIAFFIVITMIGTIISSLSTLKEEAVKTHLKIAELHAKTISEQIYQTFNNIDFLLDNLVITIKNRNNSSYLEKKFNDILSTSPYIRSINLLNSKKIVINSSNKMNNGLYIEGNDFYPKPLFDKYILRFGNPWIGRDLVEGIEVTKADSISASSSSFFPISKMLTIDGEIFYILININSDYFINKYDEILKEKFAIFDLIRIDKMLLFSSNLNHIIGSHIGNEELFNNLLEKAKSVGIETINENKFLSAYQLTPSYPLAITIKLNFEKSLKEWEEKRSNIISIISSLLFLLVILVIVLIFKHNKEKENEIEFHKKEIEAKKKFQTLFEQGIFLVATLKSDGSILEMNNLANEFVGKLSTKLNDTKFWELPCWDNKSQTWLKKEILLYEKNRNIHKEINVKNAKGEPAIIDFILTSIEIDGEIELVAIGIDITKKRESEEQLRHAYIVFQNTHDGIMITDKDANIINTNKAFTKSTAYEFEDIYMKNPRILSSGLHEKSFYTNMWEKLQKDGVWEGELINRRKDGTLYNEWLAINAVYDSNNEIKNYIGVFSDTTKQKEQERVLKEQEKLIYEQSKLAAMGEMIENIAHQWRQPLSIISTAVTGMQLQKELKLNNYEDEIKTLKSINNTAQYLSKTIDDFRDFLKTDKIKSEFSVKKSLEKSLNLISSKLKNQNIKVIKNIKDMNVEGIENELLQVFMNIFSNARDAFENSEIKNKYIFIDIYKEENKVIILIKDNAGGIKENILTRIFEPYFTTKHKSQGTGIGLYMSQEIIINHMNGAISCYNSNFEYNNKTYKGAAFKISLPL